MTTLLTLLKHCLIFCAAVICVALLTYPDILIKLASVAVLAFITMGTLVKLRNYFTLLTQTPAEIKQTLSTTIDMKDSQVIVGKDLPHQFATNERYFAHLQEDYLFTESSSNYADIDQYMQQLNLELINRKIKNCRLNQNIYNQRLVELKQSDRVLID